MFGSLRYLVEHRSRGWCWRRSRAFFDQVIFKNAGRAMLFGLVAHRRWCSRAASPPPWSCPWPAAGILTLRADLPLHPRRQRRHHDHRDPRRPGGRARSARSPWPSPTCCSTSAGSPSSGRCRAIRAAAHASGPAAGRAVASAQPLDSAVSTSLFGFYLIPFLADPHAEVNHVQRILRSVPQGPACSTRPSSGPSRCSRGPGDVRGGDALPARAGRRPARASTSTPRTR